ncbi:inositol monophosphatase family protein [Brevibacterium marinum]
MAADLSAMAWEQMTAWRSSLGAGLDAAVVDTKTSPNDLVTLADAQIESLVRGYLAKVRPGDTMVGEEGAPALDPTEFFDARFLRGLGCVDPRRGELLDMSDGGQELEWHVDPIDGTVNYVRNIEHYAFSVGVRVAGGNHGQGLSEDGWLLGLVASPGLGATWVGARGLGAYRLEGRCSGGRLSGIGDAAVPAQRLRGTPDGLSGRLLATGFAYTGSSRGPQLAKLEALMGGYDDIRRCGSAAIDLCMLAEGKVNSYAERGLGIYDYAGGAVIAEEAGARVHRGGSGGPTAAAASESEVRRLIDTI